MRLPSLLLTLTLLVVALAGGLSAQSAGNWPQWRGPSRDGVSTETGLLRTWPAQRRGAVDVQQSAQEA